MGGRTSEPKDGALAVEVLRVSGGSSDRELVSRIHGEKTDVVHGRSMALSFGIAGLCAVVVCAIGVFMFLDDNGYYAVGSALVAAMDGEPLFWRMFVFFPVVSGGALALSSVLVVAFSLLTVEQASRLECCAQGGDRQAGLAGKYGGCNKCIVFTLKIVALILVIVQFLVNIAALAALNELDSAVNSGALSSATPGSAKAKVLAFQSAVFNECCAASGWSRQGPVPPCAEGYEAGSPVACTVPRELNFYRDDLCTCYLVEPTEYSWYQAQVVELGICQTLQAATTTVPDDERIPGTPLSARTFISASEVRLVGDPLGADEGCGVGLARGFQWLLYKWMRDYFKPIIVAMLGVSVVQFFSIVYGIHINHAGEQVALLEERMRLEDEEESRKAKNEGLGNYRRGLPQSPIARSMSRIANMLTGSPNPRPQAQAGRALAPTTFVLEQTGTVARPSRPTTRRAAPRTPARADETVAAAAHQPTEAMELGMTSEAEKGSISGPQTNAGAISLDPASPRLGMQEAPGRGASLSVASIDF